MTGTTGGEHVSFTMIGIMKVRLVQVSAILGDTKLVGNLQNVTSSVTHKELIRGTVLFLILVCTATTLVIFSQCKKCLQNSNRGIHL